MTDLGAVKTVPCKVKVKNQFGTWREVVSKVYHSLQPGEACQLPFTTSHYSAFYAAYHQMIKMNQLPGCKLLQDKRGIKHPVFWFVRFHPVA